MEFRQRLARRNGLGAARPAGPAKQFSDHSRLSGQVDIATGNEALGGPIGGVGYRIDAGFQAPDDAQLGVDVVFRRPRLGMADDRENRP